jgi:hypothetical protein
MNSKLKKQQSFVKIEIAFLRIDNDSKLNYPGFDTLLPIQQDNPDTQRPFFVSGVGIVKDRSNSRNNEIVAFCGYSSKEITSQILVSSRCVKRIPFSEDIFSYSLIGCITQFIAIINKAEGCIGDKVLVLSDGVEKKIFERLLSKNGFNVIEHYDFRDQKLNLTHKEDLKIDLCIINANKMDEFYPFQTYFNKQAKIVFYNKDTKIDLGLVPSNIIVETTLGKGFFDYQYMIGRVDYPNAYVKDNVEYNIDQAVHFINENIEKIKPFIKEQKTKDLCGLIEKSNMIKTNDKIVVFNINDTILKLTDSRTYKKLDFKSSFNEKAASDFQYLFSERINPALIELTFNSNKYTLDDAISFSEKITNNEFSTIITNLKNRWVSTYKFYLNDGSLAIINIISSAVIRDYSIEAHLDGVTILLENNKIDIYK